MTLFSRTMPSARWGRRFRPPGVCHSSLTLCFFLASVCLAQRQPGNPGPKAGWDPARLKSLQQIVPLTTAVREDDHPAIAARDGRAWVAWVSYSETEATSLVY